MYILVSSLYFISIHSFTPGSYLIFSYPANLFLRPLKFSLVGETRFRHVTFKRIDMTREISAGGYCEVTHCWKNYVKAGMTGMREWNFHWLKLINWLIGLKWKTWCTYRFNFLIRIVLILNCNGNFDRSLVENLEEW